MPTYLVTYACRHTGWADRKPANGSAATCPIDGATTVASSQEWQA